MVRKGNPKKPVRQLELVELTRRRKRPVGSSASEAVTHQRNDSYASYELRVGRQSLDHEEIGDSDLLELHDLAAEAGTRT